MQRVIRFCKSITYYSLNNQAAARHLTNQMICNKNDCIILPYIDHPGPLADAILSREFKSLTVLERDKTVVDAFKDYIHNRFPDRNVHVYQEDIIDLMYELYDTEAQRRCADIVRDNSSQIERSPEKELKSDRDAQIKFLIPLMKRNSEIGTLKNIFYQVAFRLGLCTNTFVQYYFLMSDRQYRYLISLPSKNLKLYRSETVLYNTLFTINHLGTYDLREDFGLSLHTIQRAKHTETDVHLVHMKPREDIICRFDPSFMAEFRFFVVQGMFHPTRRVATFIRSWFDISEKDCAHIGIHKKTRIGDMTKEQFLLLFCFLRDLPYYKDTTFVSAAKQSEESLGYLDQISNTGS